LNFDRVAFWHESSNLQKVRVQFKRWFALEAAVCPNWTLSVQMKRYGSLNLDTPQKWTRSSQARRRCRVFSMAAARAVLSGSEKRAVQGQTQQPCH
jgi:hypothetical protein